MKYQIIPNINIDNTKLIGLLENTHYYRRPLDRMQINIEEFTYEYNQYTTTYEILLEKDDVKFFIGFDDRIKDNFDTELNICWKDATFKETDFAFIGNKTKELELKEHYFLSLKTDLRGQWPLSNILETKNILKENEIAYIRLELQPMSYEWYKEADECIKRFKEENMVATKNKIDGRTIALKAVNLALEFIYDGIDFVNEMISNEKIEHEYPDNAKYANLIRNGLSNDTLQKSKYNAYKTRIIVSVNSNGRDDILFRNILKSFNTMAGDNSFIMVDQSKYKNILSSRELAQITQMPTKFYQELYKINNIDNREIEVDDKLLNGNIKIGEVTHKGITRIAYWPNKKDILALPKIVIGPMGSGKDEYTKNFCVDAHRKGDGLIIFDYIKNCEMSEEISKHINCIKIDLSKRENLPALAYPEITYTEDPWDRLENANILARQVEYLINSLVEEPIKPRMGRYLDAASKVVFIHESGTIQDVINVLTNWEIRNEYIRRAKYSGIFTENDSEILDLQALHDRDNDGKIVGTKEIKIEGILDRISVLMKDVHLRIMCKTEINYNQNFAKWMDEGKAIIIQIPEYKFTNKQVKDTIITYYMSRVWLATLQRKNHSRVCHVITNEVHQVPTAARLISEIITEPRKFGVDFYFTIHYLKQFRALQRAITSAGASYMLLAGTEKENLVALEEEIQPFTIQEGLSLKPFHSLNVINIGNQYCKFISKLPKPIK